MHKRIAVSTSSTDLEILNSRSSESSRSLCLHQPKNRRVQKEDSIEPFNPMIVMDNMQYENDRSKQGKRNKIVMVHCSNITGSSYFVCKTVYQHLHERFFVASTQSVFHGSEFRYININIAFKALDRLFFCESN